VRRACIKFPGYKTQAEIAREQLERYAKSTNADISKEELQEFFDKYGWRPKKRKLHSPWDWIWLLIIATCICVIIYYTQ